MQGTHPTAARQPLPYSELSPTLDHLFALCPRLQYDRCPIKAKSKELTYGEVSDSFAAFLAQDVLPAPTHHTPRFLDFGAGRGRLSLSLALQCPDWCLDGVEIVAPRTRHYPQLLTAYAYHRSRRATPAC